MTLKPVALTAKAFKDYGSVIHRAAGKPMAKNAEITYWGKVATLAMGKAVSTGVLVNRRRPLVVKSLERHARTAEILVALEGDSVFCVARPSPSGKSIAGLKAFRVRRGEALALKPGTWHWVPFPVEGATSTFLVVFASGTEAKDMDVKDLPKPVRLSRG